MLSKIEFLSDTICDILGYVGSTGALKRSDHYELMVASLDDSLDEQEKKAVNRLLRFVRTGRLPVVDDCSDSFGVEVFFARN